MPLRAEADPANVATLTAEAAAHLRAGRDAPAVDAAQAALRSAPGDVAASRILGIALTRQGRYPEAIATLEAILASAPADVASLFALGNALRKGGRLVEAMQSFQRVLEIDPGSGAARFNLALTVDNLGDTRRAVRLLADIVQHDPADFDATQTLVNLLARLARETPRSPESAPLREEPESAPREAPAGPVDVAMCTVTPERAARAEASLRRALGPACGTVHVIHNPRSIAAAFNTVLSQPGSPSLILCHDDIELLCDRLDVAVAAALRGHDIVGIAGASRVTGPAVLWAGHPHLHGWVSYSREGFIEAAPLGLRGGIIPDIQALDGVFIALRRSALSGLAFDERTFDGFHFYDLDFTYRAHMAGLRMAVSTDIQVVHASEGRFGDDWRRYADRFTAKFPHLGAPQGPHHWYPARFETAGQVRHFYRELAALADPAGRAS